MQLKCTASLGSAHPFTATANQRKKATHDKADQHNHKRRKRKK